MIQVMELGTQDVLKLLVNESFIVNYDYVRWLIRNMYFDAPEKRGNRYVWNVESINRLRECLTKRGKKKTLRSDTIST